MSFTTLDAVENIAMDSTEKMNEEIQLMYRSIQKLGKIDRAIVMLYLEERTYDEIADILGITTSNVGVRINRVKSRLEKMMNRT